MKTKLIKTEVNYLLKNEEGVIIASTSIKKGISSLSKQNCDEIFGVVDVYKLAEEYVLTINDEDQHVDAKLDFIAGFNKAMELNKDKLFTYNQMVSAITESSISLRLPSLIIQDLQSTEIEVEIEMECLDINCDGVNRKGICIPGDKPKMDSEGNLILKKI